MIATTPAVASARRRLSMPMQVEHERASKQSERDSAVPTVSARTVDGDRWPLGHAVTTARRQHLDREERGDDHEDQR